MDRVDQTPVARTTGLLVEELSGETLVYDLASNRAHCLNRSAALVWSRADGECTVAEIADGLAADGVEGGAPIVWSALERLRDADLLAEEITFPDEPPRFTRKEVLRIIGAAAGMTLVFPAVDSLSAPLAAQAASCLTPAECTLMDPAVTPGCTGLPICINRSKCCKEVRRGRSVVCSPNSFC